MSNHTTPAKKKSASKDQVRAAENEVSDDPDNNVHQFHKRLSLLDDAGVSVLLVRTQEVIRCAEAIQEWAASKGDLEFKRWNFRDGWETPVAGQPGKFTSDGKIDPLAAMKMINDIKPAQNAAAATRNPWAAGVYAMAGLHNIMAKVPAMIHCVRDYAHQFASADCELRLHMIVPNGYSLPDEIAQDVPVIDFNLPGRSEIGSVLDEVIEASFDEDDEVPEVFDREGREDVISAASGLTFSEAELAFTSAIVANKTTWPDTEVADYVQVVLESKTEAIKRGNVLELRDSVPLDEVGGYDKFKEWLAETKPTFSQEWKDFGGDPARGVLIAGRPGGGKSLLGAAIAHELNLPFIYFDFNKVFQGIVGESEKAVEGALKLMEAVAPCVAFIDEIDKALGNSHSSKGDSGVSQRVLGKLLHFTQSNDKGIFFVYTANRVGDMLPPELVRPGRIDAVWYLGCPNVIERRQILDIHMEKRGQHTDDWEGQEVQAVLSASEGYTGAEIEQAVKEGLKQAFKSEDQLLTAEMLIEEFDKIQPQSVGFAEDIEKMEAWVASNARNASSEIDEDTVDASKPVQRRRRVATKKRGRKRH